MESTISMVEWLFLKGIPTYRQTLSIAISSQVQLKIPFPSILPTDIGRIIGLSTYCDTVDPANNPLITTTDAQVLYLNLKDGQQDFFTPVRLDDLLFNFAGVPTPSGEKYMPVNIPRFDASTSSILNPTSIVSPAPPSTVQITIMINLLYINDNDYTTLLVKDMVLQRGLSQKELRGIQAVKK